MPNTPRPPSLADHERRLKRIETHIWGKPPTEPPAPPEPPPTQPPAPPTVPPADPPSGNLQVIGEQRPGTSPLILRDKRIVNPGVNGYGVRANQGTCPLIEFHNVESRTGEYGIWADRCRHLKLYDYDSISGGGDDPYCLRMIVEQIDSDRCWFTNNDGKCTLRLMDVERADIDSWTVIGGQIWCGGGPETNAPATFMGFNNAIIKNLNHTFDNPDDPNDPDANTAFELFKSENVELRDASWTLGRGKAFGCWWDYCKNIRLINCRVRYWSGSPGNITYTPWEAFGWQHVSKGADVRASGKVSIT
jgi:hypothetical protein